MKVVYVAHPLTPTDEEARAFLGVTCWTTREAKAAARRANLERASRWCAWMAHRGISPIATWIVLAGQWDESPENRELGLACDLAAVARCDELWLVGGRVSPGMREEARAADAAGIRVRDLTSLGVEPPASDDLHREVYSFCREDRERTDAALRDELEDLALELAGDELRVLVLIARRLAGGRKQYGPLDTESDGRDWRREASEEWADAAVYAACEMLRRGAK